MRRHVFDTLTKLEIVGELGARLGFRLSHLGAELAVAPQPFAQIADDTCGFDDALDEDVARTIQRGLGIGDALGGIDEPSSLCLGI